MSQKLHGINPRATLIKNTRKILFVWGCGWSNYKVLLPCNKIGYKVKVENTKMNETCYTMLKHGVVCIIIGIQYVFSPSHLHYYSIQPFLARWHIDLHCHDTVKKVCLQQHTGHCTVTLRLDIAL